MSAGIEVVAQPRIIGIGSPFGADRVGWCVAECLKRSNQLRGMPGVAWEVLIRDRPGAMLLNDLHGIERAVLIDAMCSSDEIGRVRCLTIDDAITHCGLSSSHGFGVGEALSLGRMLGELPRDLSIFGVEIPVDGEELSGDEFEAMAHRAAMLIEGQLLG